MENKTNMLSRMIMKMVTTDFVKYYNKGGERDLNAGYSCYLTCKLILENFNKELLKIDRLYFELFIKVNEMINEDLVEILNIEEETNKEIEKYIK